MATREELQEQKRLYEEAFVEVEGTLEDHTLAPERAAEILTERFGEDYFAQYQAVKSELRKRQLINTGSGLLVGIVIAFLLGMLVQGGITGAFLIDRDRPYTLEVSQGFEETTTFITDITENISSLRATGTYTGTKGFRLVHTDGAGNTRTIHTYDAPIVEGPVLGENGTISNTTPARTVRFAAACEETCELDESAGPHRLEIELLDGNLSLDTLDYTVREQREVIEENETEQEPKPPAVPPAEKPTPEAPSATGNMTEPINETEGPEAETNTTDNGTGTVPPAPAEPQNDTNQTEGYLPEENGTVINLTGGDYTVIIGTPNETINDTPAINLTPPQNQTPSENITAEGPCGCSEEEVCINTAFQGMPQQACASTTENCALDGHAFPHSTEYGGNTCYATQEGSVWLARSGRYTIAHQSADNPVAVIDRYGSMALAGELYTQANSFSPDWRVQSSTGIVASISTQGDLALRGSVSLNATEMPRGLRIQRATQNGPVTVAVFASDGSLHLAGDLVSSVDLS